LDLTLPTKQTGGQAGFYLTAKQEQALKYLNTK
jgi:hypothetical protein